MGRCGRMHKEFTNSHIEEYCTLNQFMFDLFIKNKSELEEIYNQSNILKTRLKSDALEYTEFTP